MLSKLARRLGFQQSVPVSLVDDWEIPTPTVTPIELAPRGGVAHAQVDQFGRLQVQGESWTLELTLAGGVRWVPVAANERVSQQMVSPGVVETTVRTPVGPVVQRVAAGVVDGEPVAIIEIENTARVAIAVGVAARPLRLDGRGYLQRVAVDAAGFELEGRQLVRFGSNPATVAATDGAAGDLMQNLPDPDDGTQQAAAECRSGGAQAVAVWPVPHTATLRMVVALDREIASSAAVPTAADISRGWKAHLQQGLRVEVDDLEVGQELAGAAQTLLTQWPDRRQAPATVLAMSELGFGRDAGRLFELVERSDDDASIVRSLARWAQLGDQTHQLEDLEMLLGRVAKAAHVIATGPNVLVGPAWLPDALVALGGRLHQIDQPDVAERVQNLPVEVRAIEGAADRLAQLAKQQDKRRVWPEHQLESSAGYLRALRAAIAADTGTELALLPDLPQLWRGRSLDVHNLAVANGQVSFGLRWHGPRPALLWEARLAPEVPFQLTVPSIDPGFSSTEREGETLLADPGWSKA